MAELELQLADEKTSSEVKSHDIDEVLELSDRVDGWHYRLLKTDSGVNHVVFNHDSTKIAVSLQNTHLLIYSVNTGDLLKTIKGHTDAILSAKWSRDDKFVITNGRDETIRVWDVDAGQQTALLDQHTKWGVMDVSYDGELAASGSGDGLVHVWPFANGKIADKCESRVFTGHTEWVLVVVFSSDAQFLASAGDDRTVKVWDVKSGKTRTTLNGHTDGVYSLCFLDNDKRLASGSTDKTVKVWSTVKNCLLATLNIHSDRIWGLTSLAQGKRSGILVSASGDKSIVVSDTATLALVSKLSAHTGTVYAVDISHTGKLLASCGQDNAVRIWDIRPKSAGSPPLRGHKSGVTTLDFDSSHLVSGGKDNKIIVWNAFDGSIVATLDKHKGPVNKVQFFRKGRDGLAKALVSVSEDHTVVVWAMNDHNEFKEEFTVEAHDGGVTSVDVSNSNDFLVTGGKDKAVKVWDIASGTCTVTLQAESEVTSVDFSPDGTILATTAGSDCCTRLWDTKTWKIVRTVPADNWVFCAAFDPSGNILAAGDANRKVVLHNLKTEQEIFTLAGHEDWVMSVKFSDDGTTLASACSLGKSIRVWDTNTGHLLAILKDHTATVNQVAFSEDGALLASGSEDHNIHLTDMVVLRCRPSYALAVQLLNEMLQSNPQDAAEGVKAAVRLLEWWMVHAPQVVNIRDPRTHSTLLHWACSVRQPALLNVMLTSSCFRVYAVDVNGNSPVDVCLNYKATYCLNSLMAKVPSIPLADRWVVSRPSTLSRLVAEYPALTLRLFNTLNLDVSHPDIRVFEDTEMLRLPPGETLFAGSALPYPGHLWTKESTDEKLAEMVPLWQSAISSLVCCSSDSDENQEAEDAPLLDRRKTTIEDTEAVIQQQQSELANEVPVTVLSVGLPGAGAAKWTMTAAASRGGVVGPLRLIVTESMVDLIGTPIVKAVLDWKWYAYGKRLLLRDFAVYLVLLTLFCVGTLIPEGAANKDLGENVGLIGAAVLSVYFLYRELLLMRGYGLAEYFGEVWSWFHVITYLLVVAAVPSHLLDWRYRYQVESAAAVLLWFKVLGFCRAFQGTGMFVRMVFAIVAGIVSFTVVLSLVFLGFSHGFYILFRSSGPLEAGPEYNSWFVLMKMYQVLLGGLGPVNEYEGMRGEWLATVFLLIYSIFVSVVLLNLLIALMGDIYAQVQDRVVNEWLLERARILLDLEVLLDHGDTSLFPQHIHMIKTTDDFNEIKEEDATLDSVQDTLQAAVKESHSSLQNQVNTMQSTLSELTLQLERLNAQLKNQ